MNKKTLYFLFFISGIIFFPLAASATVPEIVTSVQNAFVTVGGSIVVIGWVIAGILYLTAAGNATKLEIAKKALFACVIGTALIVLAGVAEELIDALLNNPFGN